MKKIIHISESKLALIWSLFLVAYTLVRATTLDLTCDEGTTFFNLVVEKTNAQVLFDMRSFDTANNHVLNTYLARFGVWVFGETAWALRLHSVVALGVFLWFSWRFFAVLLPVFARLPLFVLLVSNPYVLDFFCLSRGYSWALAAEMASLYYFLSHKNKQSAAWIFVGVMANFTFLNFAILFFAVQNLSFLLEKLDLKRILKANLPILCVFGTLALLISKPIQTLKKNGEFLYGNDFLLETFESIRYNSVHGGSHLAGVGEPIVGYVFSFLFIFVIPISIFIFLKKSLSIRPFLVTFLPIFATLLMVLQYHFLGSKYLINRTALTLFPLLFGSLFVWFLWLRGRWAVILGFILGGGGFFHFYRTVNFRETQEWYYEKFTTPVIKYLDDKAAAENRTFWVGTSPNWQPSFGFYFRQLPSQRLKKKTFDAEIRRDSFYDFYYIEKKELSIIEKHYKLEKTFGDFLLMRRKD